MFKIRGPPVHLYLNVNRPPKCEKGKYFGKGFYRHTDNQKENRIGRGSGCMKHLGVKGTGTRLNSKCC